MNRIADWTFDMAVKYRAALERIADLAQEGPIRDVALDALGPSRGVCTGISARWCPVHGDCTTVDAYSPGELCADDGCPLHGPVEWTPMTGKALTLHQPYASLVVAGVKTIETRSRRMNYRGRLYVHAGAKKPTFRDGTRQVGPYFCSPDDTAGGDWVAQSDGPDLWLPLGAVVGHVDVVDCLPMVSAWPGHDVDCVQLNTDTGRWWQMFRDRHPSEAVPLDDQVPFGHFTPGRWAILLADPVRYDEPIPARGKQGLWTWDVSHD